MFVYGDFQETRTSHGENWKPKQKMPRSASKTVLRVAPFFGLCAKRDSGFHEKVKKTDLL